MLSPATNVPATLAAAPLATGLVPRRAQPRVVGAVGATLLVGAAWLAPRYGARQSALFLVGAALGVVLYHAAFGFTAAFRALVTRGDGRGIRAQMLMLAVATVLFAPLLARGAAFGVGLGGAAARRGAAPPARAVAAPRGGGGARGPQRPHARPRRASVGDHLGVRALGGEVGGAPRLRPLDGPVLERGFPAGGGRGAGARRRHLGHGPGPRARGLPRRRPRRAIRARRTSPAPARRRLAARRAPSRLWLADRLRLQHRRLRQRHRLDEPARLALGRRGAPRHAGRGEAPPPRRPRGPARMKGASPMRYIGTVLVTLVVVLGGVGVGSS